MPKYSPRHSQRNRPGKRILFLTKLSNHDLGKPRQFLRGRVKNLPRQSVSIQISSDNSRKQCRKIRTCIRIARKLTYRTHIPHQFYFPKQTRTLGNLLRAENSIHAALDRPQQSTYRLTPDPMRRAFIRNRKSPSTRARAPSLRISAVGNRARAGDHDNPGLRTECRFHRDLHVTGHQDFPSKHFRNHCTYRASNLPVRRASHPNATPRNLADVDLRLRTSLPNRAVQRLACAIMPNASHIARPGCGARQNRRFIPDNARRLASAAVNSQIVRHASVLSHDADLAGLVEAEDTTEDVTTPSLAQAVDSRHN